MDSKRVSRKLSRHRFIRQVGLTLIELLIAISVLAFVAVLGWRGLDSIVRTRVALNEDLAQTRGLQLAFAQMQTDGANLASALLVPDRPVIEIGNNRLMLVRSSSSEDQPTRLQVITYLVRDGVLSRKESLPTRDLNELQQIWTAALNDFNTSDAVVLQTGVTSMDMRVWDGKQWRTGVVDASSSSPTLEGGRISKGEVERQATGRRAAGTPTGLEVALQLQQGEAAMLKVFLLGVL